MIDTMIITKNCKELGLNYSSAFNNINNFLSKYNFTILHKDPTCKYKKYVSAGLSNWGLLEISVNKTQFNSTIKIKLQPIRLLYKNDLIRLSYDIDYRNISDRFNLMISEMILPNISNPLEEYPSLKFENWTVSRIDYAFNFYTDNIETYLYLLHKGKIPTGYTLHPYETSLYLTSKKANINFYSKKDALLSKIQQNKLPHNTSLSAAEGLLRFEVQCKSKLIQKLKAQYGLHGTSVHYLWNNEIATNVIISRIKAVIGTSDFYTLSKARERIMNLDSHHVLSNIITATHEYNLNHLYELKTKPVQKGLDDLKELGINPITIPDTCNLDDYMLENPYTTIKKSYICSAIPFIPLEW